MNVGIDYGMGRANVDLTTGIRYGVIAQHNVGQAWYDEAEANYGKASCPKCGNDAVEYDSDKDGTEDSPFDAGHGCADHMCLQCEYVFDSSEAYGDEPQGWNWIAIQQDDSTALKIADEAKARLADYPVLDEDDWSEREQEAANETWTNCYSWKERIEYIRQHCSQFEFRDYADMIGCVRGQYFCGYASELLT